MILYPRVWRVLALLLAAMGSIATASAQTTWPQEVVAPEGTIVIYQPQPESLKGNVLTARAAMSLELAGKDKADKQAPIFGAFWFTGKIDTDTDDGTANVRDVRVTQVRWPDMTESAAGRFTKIVEAAVPTAGYEISMERLSASLASTAQEQKSLGELKNDAPKIVFSEQLAVLLLYDGAPKFAPVADSNYERALNTPFAVARNTKTKHVYLSSGSVWYHADDPLGPWSQTTTPPTDIKNMLASYGGQDPVPTKIPAIVTATAPTELIATDGKPNWASLSGGKILYVKNTETPWLREVSGAEMYVLLSGRWFSAKQASGPWAFVRADKLPASFKEIPADSDIGGVRVSVAGTDEANDALLDAQIPQTAAIKRNEAKLDVQYDGAPKFEKIAGTSVSYAVNTGAQVLAISGRYYAVDNGVWFTATQATGPWTVADKIPEQEIQKIPPSSPMYNTTYVTIYQSTPQVVYVGYTPGYMWSYPYYGVPVYGTGWYYPPYWGAVYYPRTPTWGMHVGYNPYTGWNYGVSWSNGFMSVGVSWGGGYSHRPPYCCGGGWYGGGYHHNNNNVNINTGDINIGNSVNIKNRNNINNGNINNGNIKAGNNNARNNLYKQSGNTARNADRATAQQSLKQARPATGRENNVYADKNGNLAQRNGDQWQSREQGAWKNDQTRQPMQDRTPAQQPRQSFDRTEMNRAHQTRQSGASREMSRPSRGGGGGRRR